MTQVDAKAAGKVKVGALEVCRLGFGAMRVTGEGVWGEPKDHAEAIKVLKRVPELGIEFIDTADAYGPEVSERLIKEALHPYKNVHVATKGGLTRQGPGEWLPVGRPEYLRQCVQMSLRRLGVERLDLWQLHRIDAKVPRDEQFDAMKQFQQEGLVRELGLSEVKVEDIEAASKYFKVASVQNEFNLVTRKSEDVLDYCTKQGIAFIPWFPLAAGSLANSGSLIDDLAKEHKVSAGSIALAWILKRSPVMLPIPGTSKVAHLEENVRGASFELDDAAFKKLDEQGRAEWKKNGAQPRAA